MPTTTFIDIKMTETVDRYVYENEEYKLEKDAVYSMPRHTAFSFVNKSEVADYDSQPYDVKDEEYDDLLMLKKSNTCQETKSDGEVCGREKPCQYHDKDEE